LGSTLAWYHFLSQKGHEAVVISPNEYPSFLKWLPGENKILKYVVNIKLSDLEKINTFEIERKNFLELLKSFNSFRIIKKI
jgi:phosphoesterase RecJ-like protein